MIGMLDLGVDIAAGVLTAVVVWLGQWSVRRRRLQRTRDFFGLVPGSECLLVVNRHRGVDNELSVHRMDVFALLELAGLVRRCGARIEVAAHDEVRQGFGDKAEFCIGGPVSNSRAAAHLKWKLPGLDVSVDRDEAGVIRVGEIAYPLDQQAPYVLLAKVAGPEQSRPVFLISGQRAITNQAAVRYLVTRERQLARKYGPRGRFALVLRVINPEAYGPDVVEPVADVTRAAFAAPADSPVARPTGAE